MNEYFLIYSFCFSALELLNVEGNRFIDHLIGALSVLELQHLHFLLLQLLVVLEEPK